jgi:ribosomal protein S18 acetylase RimI-like enzyme
MRWARLANASRQGDAMKFEPIMRDHIRGIVDLCRVEGYPSFLESDDITWRALTAPGVTTIVCSEEDQVLGFAQMLSDGLIQSHLSLIVVGRTQRRRGIGRRLIEEAFARAGGKRVDLVSTEGADEFYESFGFQRFPGFRIYPQQLS